MLFVGTCMTQTCESQVPMLLVSTWICDRYPQVHRYLTCGSGYPVPDTCIDPGMSFGFLLTHRYRSRSPTDQLMLSLSQIVAVVLSFSDKIEEGVSGGSPCDTKF